MAQSNGAPDACSDSNSSNGQPEIPSGDPQNQPVLCSHRVWCFIGTLLLASVSSLIYVRSLNYDMIFDDMPAILENESVHQLSPLFGDPDGIGLDRYGPLNPKPNTPLTARPIVNLAFAINYHFGGKDPHGYRVLQVVMHSLTAILLWAIVAITLRQPRLQEYFADYRLERYRHPLALFSALLWLVHPCHTETVIYLTQRTELMMGLFYLLTLLACLCYWESDLFVKRLFWLVTATASCVVGMMCKEMMASVPAMVLLYEWTFVKGTVRERLKKSWLLYLCLSLGWLPIAALYQSGYTTPMGGFNNTISAVDWWMTQANAFFVYWKFTFVPWPLVLHHQVPTLTSLAQAWPGVSALMLYTVATTWLLLRRHPIGYVLVWYFAALSPTLIVPLPTEEISVRRLYVPLATVAPLFVVGLFVMIQRMRGEHSTDQTNSSLSFGISQGLVLGVTVLFTVVCIKTMPRLSDRQTIWTEVLKYEPHNSFAFFNQGCVEFNRGDRDSGLEKMWASYHLQSDYKHGVITLAKALEDSEKLDELVPLYRKACESDSQQPAFRYNLAIWLENSGDLDEAAEHYRKTLEMDPSYDAAHTNLALLLAEQGKLVPAISHLESAVESNPDFVNCMNLMNVYLKTKQFKKATYAAKMLLVAAREEGKPEIAEQIENSLEALESLSP